MKVISLTKPLSQIASLTTFAMTMHFASCGKLSHGELESSFPTECTPPKVKIFSYQDSLYCQTVTASNTL